MQQIILNQEIKSIFSKIVLFSFILFRELLTDYKILMISFDTFSFYYVLLNYLKNIHHESCIFRVKKTNPLLRIYVQALLKVMTDIISLIFYQFQSKLEENLPEPQAIYLEGALGHDSQILVADSQIKEEVYDSELNGSAEEPAV